MHNTDNAGLQWRKSSHSGGGNDCVEVTFIGSTPAVRDSKNPDGGAVLFDAAQWRRLLDAVRTDRLA